MKAKEEKKEIKSLFEIIIKGDILDNTNIVKKRLKRKYHSMYDDAEDKILTCEKDILKEYSKLDNCDLNFVLKKRQEITLLKSLQDLIVNEYYEMFSELMENL